MNRLDLFYQIKPIIPRRMQIILRRAIASHKRKSKKYLWPIDPNAAKKPEGWMGWPDKKRFALILQHDVDTVIGLRNCARLMDVEKRWDVRSAFNFVPEDYATLPSLRKDLGESGFEVGVHGLKHDGKFFKNRQTFDRNMDRANQYLKEWNALGFTSPSMLRNMAWMAELNIEHGCSTFDTDPFEPQSKGMGTIFPFLAWNSSKTKSYVELPYTLPQDHCLFIILKEKTIDIWKQKLDWVASNGGMAALNTHPDYMNFWGTSCSNEEYPITYYTAFLEYVKTHYEGQFWQALPRELASYWKTSMIKHESPNDPLNRLSEPRSPRPLS